MVLPLAMGWRHLLFENYPIEPATLDARLPDALDVDVHDGSGWLSVVPFTNVQVRPAGLPARLGLPLPELNLRTYVTCDGEPGVYFFSLDAQGVLGVTGARLFHHLPYYYARISLGVADGGDDDGAAVPGAPGAGGLVRFTCRRRHPGARPAAYAATYGPSGPSFSAEPGSLAAFLTERYRFYTEDPAGRVRYADIDHERWTLYPATATVERNTLFAADGFERPDAEPTCYYSPGVDVRASRSKRRRDERADGRGGGA
jgi:hypothetical protein